MTTLFDQGRYKRVQQPTVSDSLSPRRLAARSIKQHKYFGMDLWRRSFKVTDLNCILFSDVINWMTPNTWKILFFKLNTHHSHLIGFKNKNFARESRPTIAPMFSARDLGFGCWNIRLEIHGTWNGPWNDSDCLITSLMLSGNPRCTISSPGSQYSFAYVIHHAYQNGP